MSDIPRNDFPPVITGRQDHLPDSRTRLRKIEFYFNEVGFENKRSILAGEVLAISRELNHTLTTPFIGRKTALRLPFGKDVTQRLKGKILTLSETFAFESYSSTYQHAEPTEIHLRRTAVFIKSVNYVESKQATLIEGIIADVGERNSVLAKMAEGRSVRFTSFTPIDRIFVGKTYNFDHLYISLRAADAECTLHGVDRRIREDVPYTPENIEAFHQATIRAAEASQRTTRKKGETDLLPPETGEAGPT